jgi:hypothetical protein
MSVRSGGANLRGGGGQTSRKHIDHVLAAGLANMHVSPVSTDGVAGGRRASQRLRQRPKLPPTPPESPKSQPLTVPKNTKRATSVETSKLNEAQEAALKAALELWAKTKADGKPTPWNDKVYQLRMIAKQMEIPKKIVTAWIIDNTKYKRGLKDLDGKGYKQKDLLGDEELLEEALHEFKQKVELEKEALYEFKQKVEQAKALHEFKQKVELEKALYEYLLDDLELKLVLDEYLTEEDLLKLYEPLFFEADEVLNDDEEGGGGDPGRVSL